MHLRLVVVSVVTAIGIGTFGCSSGLGNNLPPGDPQDSVSNANLPLGIDLGVVPTSAVVDPQVAGVVVPAIGAVPERELVLLSFTTEAAANDADGAGTALSRDPVVDGNGQSDVFVAAVSARDVETRAFSQALAGKFRHPRCTTCHSMQAADTQAFASSSQPHAGPLPGPGFPNNDPSTCGPCHVTSTLFPVPGWQAPAASFDLRNKSVRELAQAARNVPIDETEHFVSDPRVLWALDSGILPQVGGRNGIADDDHDGTDEPEDNDGVVRTVPGGSARFLEEIEAWIASGRVDTTAGAVVDVTLVSRANGAANASNGASRGPRLLWTANPSFNPQSAASAFASNPVGTLYVVYESTGSNIAGIDGNGAADVFQALVELRVEEDANGAPLAGGLNLRYLDGSTTICSARNGTLAAGNGASTRPSIGGNGGQLVAFQSLATDLIAGFTDGNGPTGADVFVRQVNTNNTLLVSHNVGDAATGGNGTSEGVTMASNGVAAAFESEASDLQAGDANGVRDVFWSRINTGSPFAKQLASIGTAGAQGTGGACRAAAIAVRSGAQVLVAYESDKQDLATVAAGTNVFLYDSATDRSTLLNERRSPTGNAIGNGSARAPSISANGDVVAFASAANNLDVLRPADNNKSADIFLVEVGQVATGAVLPFRASITTAEGADADGPSASPALGSFSGGRFPIGLLAYTTDARNVGTTDSTKFIVSFLAETSGVLANFTPSVSRGAAPLTVTFTDNSSGSPTSWQWDFDNDGTIDATEQNPTHVYTTPGSYSVRLVARNGNGEGVRTIADAVVAVGLPVASFSSLPTSGTAPLSVQFTDESTQSPTGWQWDFDNDGNVDSTERNPTYVYTAPGSYTVRLVASNEAGTGEVITPNAVEAFVPVVAGFTRNPASGTVPFAVTFTNVSTGATSFAWDFDEDGLVDSNAADPVFTYTVAGVYDVRLTATGPGGSNTLVCPDCVTANGVVSASFTMTVGGSPVTSAYTGTAINFTSTSTGTITSYAWDFDNNPATTESTAANPTRSFNNSSVQVFTIRLTVNGPGGSSFATRTLTSVPASETVTIEPERDSTIYSNASSGNGNGAGSILVSGRTAADAPSPPVENLRRALLQFDIDGNVPAGSTINAAELRLTHLQPPGTIFTPVGNQTFTLRRLTQSWTEGTSANNASPGVGAAATGGDVTWDDRTSPSLAWTTPGGTFAAGSSGSSVVGDTYTNFTWSVSTAVVQNMLNSPTTNFGWILIGNESANRTVKWFGSGENPVADRRPKLTLTFTRPLP